MSIIPSMNPITSKFSLIVQEYDISSLKQTQRDLVAVQEAQDLFLASISHELRSPLHGIIGLASSLHGNQTLSAGPPRHVPVLCHVTCALCRAHTVACDVTVCDVTVP